MRYPILFAALAAATHVTYGYGDTAERRQTIIRRTLRIIGLVQGQPRRFQERQIPRRYITWRNEGLGQRI